MSEALKSLNNIRTLRAQGRELPLEVLEEILEKLNVIVDERRQEESSKAAELQARQEKLDALLKWERLPLVRAELGTHAPLVGAASLLAVSAEMILH